MLTWFSLSDFMRGELGNHSTTDLPNRECGPDFSETPKPWNHSGSQLMISVLIQTFYCNATVRIKEAGVPSDKAKWGKTELCSNCLFNCFSIIFITIWLFNALMILTFYNPRMMPTSDNLLLNYWKTECIYSLKLKSTPLANECWHATR